MQVRVVGLCGKARSGKDTFARFLADALTTLGHDATIMSMAEPIKEMLRPVLEALAPNDVPPWEFMRECLSGERKEQPLNLTNPRTSPRSMLQTLGTDWGRMMVDTNLWIKIMDRRIAKWVEEDDLPWEQDPSTERWVIIPDIRFDNEAEYLDGQLIKIVRPNAEEVNAHVSEDGISEDYIMIKVYNDEDLDALRNAAGLVAEELVRDATE